MYDYINKTKDNSEDTTRGNKKPYTGEGQTIHWWYWLTHLLSFVCNIKVIVIRQCNYEGNYVIKYGAVVVVIVW